MNYKKNQQNFFNGKSKIEYLLDASVNSGVNYAFQFPITIFYNFAVLSLSYRINISIK